MTTGRGGRFSDDSKESRNRYPAKNTVVFDSKPGSFAYDLTDCREMAIQKKSGSKSKIGLIISGGSAKNAALSHSEIGNLTGSCRKESGVVTVSAEN